jgi:hypothetical protein
MYDKTYNNKALFHLTDQAERDAPISIPLVHVRKDFFKANFYHDVTPATYNARVQKEFADKYDWNEVSQFMTVTFSLPTWSELYGDDEFGEYVETHQHHRNTQTLSETEPKDIIVQVEDCDGVTIRTVITRVGDTVVRRHVRFEDTDNNDDDTEPISPIPHDEHDSDADWDETAFMEVEGTDDEKINNTQPTFANDIDNWQVINTIKNKKTRCLTARILPSSKSAFSHCPSVIDTNGLYYRPIYYCAKNHCYYINANSKLYKTLMNRPING